MLRLFLIAGHDRRCPPEGPDGVQVKCKLTQTRGELAHHHKQFRPRVQKQQQPPQQILISQLHIKQAVTFRMAGSKRRQCDKCWLRVLQILFSQNSSQSGRGRVGASPRSIMISNWARNYLSSDLKNVPPLSFLSLDYLPSSGRLSSPGHKSFFSTFFVSKTTEHDEGGARWRAGFLSRKKTEKGQISAARQVTRWRIWRLWFWYTTQVNK